MKIFQILLFVLILCGTAGAQSNSIQLLQRESLAAGRKVALPVDTSKRWKKGMLFNLNLAQSSLSNWSAGGDKFSLSVNSILNLFAKYTKGRNSWDNTFDLNLGYVNSTSLGSRKNDDRFDFVSKYGRSINKKTNFALLTNLRSSFFKGYTFNKPEPQLISNFLAPGYLLVSTGVDFRPNSNLSIFLSPVTARWVLVMDPVLSAKGSYGVDPGKRSNLETGSFATLNFLKDIAPNITYKAKLDLFSNYMNNPQNIDLFMTNLVSIKLAKFLSMSWAVDLIYDDDARVFGPDKTSPGLQVRSMVGLGVQFKR